MNLSRGNCETIKKTHKEFVVGEKGGGVDTAHFYRKDFFSSLYILHVPNFFLAEHSADWHSN